MSSALFENLVLHGSRQAIPAFLYGTAWKKERSADLVYQALCSGFRGVDTAAQPKHYREDLVGDGTLDCNYHSRSAWLTKQVLA